MGFAEVAHGDGSVHRRDDLGQLYVVGSAGERVATADSSLRPDETGAFQGEEDLFEVRLGESGALGDVAHRSGSADRLVEGQAQESPTRIITSGRNTHERIVGGRDETPADDATSTAVVD